MQDLMPLSEIRTALADRRIMTVAANCGLTHPTLKRILDGDENITLNTWRKLSDYLRGQ